MIENHPDISLTGFLERDLRIAAADPSVVTEIRSLWLAQIAHYADNWHVLLNAGNSMGLADPELAAQWLWQGCKLQPDNWEVAGALGYIYANAIAGIVAYGADLQPTAIDRSRSHSEFSQRAWNEASQDAVLATATGRYLHSLTMAHTSMGVVRIDYDPLAEQLFEKAQNLQYPAATPFNELGFLYENQSWKRGDAAVRLTPKSRIIDLTPTEAAQRVVPRPAVPRVVGVRVRCEIVVGTDGHVWTSLAKDAPPKDEVAQIATKTAPGMLVFRPLRIGDEPVRFRTTVTVILEAHGAGWAVYAEMP